MGGREPPKSPREKGRQGHPKHLHFVGRRRRVLGRPVVAELTRYRYDRVSRFYVGRFGGREPPKSLLYRAFRGGREPPKPPREGVDRVDLSTHASLAGGGGSWVDLSLLRAEFKKERVGAAQKGRRGWDDDTASVVGRR